MQQRIGVGQQKPVVLAVQGAYFFVDVIEQLQFVEVLQREAATVYRAILLRAESFRILKQGYQAGFGKADNLVLARRCLGSQFLASARQFCRVAFKTSLSASRPSRSLRK